MQNRLESRPRQSSPWWSSGEAASLSRFRVQLILRNGCRHPQWIANRIACIRSYASALRRSSTDSGRCSLRSERQPSSDKRRSKSLWGRFEPSGERVEIRWGCPVAAVERQTARLGRRSEPAQSDRIGLVSAGGPPTGLRLGPRPPLIPPNSARVLRRLGQRSVVGLRCGGVAERVSG